MFLGLSYLISHEYITNELLLRYLTGHPISQVTVAMFFVGLASLAMIGRNIAEQFFTEQKITLSGEWNGEGTLHDATLQDRVDAQAEHLESMPDWMQGHYLWQRIGSALAHIRRTDSTATVEEELKYLGDLDIDRQQQRYSLVRILIWATPMLGFLGTVLGISEALGGINVGAGNDFQGMMNGLRGSLYVAFDTTALALTLSMVLMFVLFLADRFEVQLLTLVDQKARGEVAHNFDLTVSNAEMQKLSDGLMDLTEKSVDRQVEIWKKTIQAAEQAWSSSLTQTNSLVQSNLTDALDENVSNLAHYLGEAISKADDVMTRRLQQWQVTLSQNARSMAEHQQRLADQAGQIEKLVSSNGGSEVFENVVEQNRSAIDATKQLRNTLSTLSESVSTFHDASLAAVNDVRQHLVESSAKESLINDVLGISISERSEVPMKQSNVDDRRVVNDNGQQDGQAKLIKTKASANTLLVTTPIKMSEMQKLDAASVTSTASTVSPILTSKAHQANGAQPMLKPKDVATPAKPKQPEPCIDLNAEVIIKFPATDTARAEAKSKIRSASSRASDFLASRRQRAA